MKKNKIFKTVSIVLSGMLLCSTLVAPVNAKEVKVVVPYAYESVTESVTVDLGAIGSVVCTARMQLNITTGYLKLTGYSVTSYFSRYYPLAGLTGWDTCNYNVGDNVVDDIKITFKYYDQDGNVQLGTGIIAM